MLNHLIHVHYDLFTKSVSIATGHICCYWYPDFSTSAKHKLSFATFQLSLPISLFFFVFLVKISSDVTQVFFSMFSFSTVEGKTSIIQSIKCIILQIRLKVDHRERCVFFFLGIFAVHLKKLGALWISLHLLTAQLYNDNENTAWQQKPCNGKSSQIDFHTIEDWTESNGYKVVKQHLKRNIKHNTCFGKWSVGM